MPILHLRIVSRTKQPEGRKRPEREKERERANLMKNEGMRFYLEDTDRGKFIRFYTRYYPAGTRKCAY